MPPDDARINHPLLAAVPASARVVLLVGCGDGALGAALRASRPGLTVYGLERRAGPAAAAAAYLDRVFRLDVNDADPPLAAGSLDCILYGDVLERLSNPAAVLRRHRRLLATDGCVLCSVPNAQHHAVLAALLTSDFPCDSAGPLDDSPRRFYTYSTLTKWLLEAGLAPSRLSTTVVPGEAGFHQACAPLLAHLGLDAERMRGYLDASRHLFRGDPVGYLGEGARPATEPLSFVVCVNDEATLRANLLRSPDLAPGSIHEVLLFRDCGSAAAGLNAGLARARHRWVVFLHQDVYLPAGWAARFVAAVAEAEAAFGPPGVIGVYGVRRQGASVERVGQVVDRERLLREAVALPATVDTLDELLLALPRDTPMRFDPSLGFHFYGADICLAAQEAGRPAVAVEALGFHHSRGAGLPPAFHASAEVFARKWAHRLPVATTCAWVLGSSATRPPSAADLPNEAFFPGSTTVSARLEPPAPSKPEPPTSGAARPPATVDAFHRLYYDSLGWDRNFFLGFQIKQCPFDMQAYQEVVFHTRPQVIVQTGVAGGGSLLYFATLLDLLGAPPEALVVGVDLQLSPAARRLRHPRIRLVEGSSTAPDVLRQAAALTAGRRGLVSLDSDHRAPHVLAELRAYQEYVAPNNYLVAEDTNINGHPVVPGFGPGPFEAVELFLREAGDVFQRDAAVWQRHLFSFHQHGWLRRHGTREASL